MAFVEIVNLSAFYGKAQALREVSLSVGKGETVAVVGANGAGKSTLLDSLIGMVRVSGEIRLDGVSLLGISTPRIVSMGVGYAPERFNLFPDMTVRDNLMAGGYRSRERIAENLEMVYDLFPRLRERQRQESSTQSGGERQMVSLGRALMTSPKLLLVDEPTIGLAPKVCLEIASALRRLREEFGLTVLVTEQNANFALSLADRIHVLEGGEIAASGTAEELAKDDRLSKAYFGT